MKADKFICIVDGKIHDKDGHLIQFMTLKDADIFIRSRADRSELAASYVKANNQNGSNNIYPASFQNGVGFDSGVQGFAIGGEECSNRSSFDGYLPELAAAAFVCKGGVKRVQLIDGTLSGALLLELLTRDGIGTMVASDLYEGIRMATVTDLPEIKRLIQPMEKSGALIQRTDDELLQSLGNFLVVERDGSIIACGALIPFCNEMCGEVAAIAVSPECRGSGQGGKLLDYIEKTAKLDGLERLFLLTTRAADWFVKHGFSECSIDAIPAERRKRINLSRGSKYYVKNLCETSKSKPLFWHHKEQ